MIVMKVVKVGQWTCEGSCCNSSSTSNDSEDIFEGSGSFEDANEKEHEKVDEADNIGKEASEEVSESEDELFAYRESSEEPFDAGIAEELALLEPDGDEVLLPMPTFVLQYPANWQYPSLFPPPEKKPDSIEKLSTCKLCNFKVIENQNRQDVLEAMKDHNSKKHSTFYHECELCGYKSKRKSHIRSHMMTQNHKEAVQRQDEEQLKKRTMTMFKRNSKAIECKGCTFKADPMCYVKSMKEHMKDEHNNDPKILKDQFTKGFKINMLECNICKYEAGISMNYNKRGKSTYKSFIALRVHWNEAHDGFGTSPLLCPVCDKSFKSEKVLRAHIKTCLLSHERDVGLGTSKNVVGLLEKQA